MTNKDKNLSTSFLRILNRVKDFTTMDTKRLLIGVSIALAATTAQAKMTTEAMCSWAPSQFVVVDRITSAAGGAAAGAGTILQAAKSKGLKFVEHSSGRFILTSRGGYVTGTLLATETGIIPVVITVSVVVGGAAIALELWCAPVNHPDAVKKVKAITAEFQRALLSANSQAIDVRDATGKKIKELNNHAIDVRDAAAVEFRDGASQFFAKGKLLSAHVEF